jgi:beta-lactamase regulating signal transducer with metallopeptidase domain
MVFFQTKNPNLGKFLDGIGMEKVGLFLGHLKYITAILYILWPFGNLVAILYIFLRFGTLCQEKSGNPDWNKTDSRHFFRAKTFRSFVVRSLAHFCSVLTQSYFSTRRHKWAGLIKRINNL